MNNIDLADVILRLIAAAAIGMAFGLNRDMHGKPTGMRTLGLVGLGAAIATLGTLHAVNVTFAPPEYSRVLQGVIQGVLTGIGFLGGGVILRSQTRHRVHNITTAATVWVTAALGMSCAVADWRILAVGFVLALVLLVFGGWIERLIEPLIGKREIPAEDRD
jgi:putative Mg2+ transporter-C (MgtC) family protein